MFIRANRRSALALAALPAVLGTLGCYAYLPVRDESALTGRRASLLLTDSGSVVLGSRIGAGMVALEGVYLGDSASSHLLAVSQSRQRDGQEIEWRGEHVAVPRVLVASLQERSFSASQTALAGALATIGLVAITAALRGKGDGGGGGPGPTTTRPGN